MNSDSFAEPQNAESAFERAAEQFGLLSSLSRLRIVSERRRVGVPLGVRRFRQSLRRRLSHAARARREMT